MYIYIYIYVCIYIHIIYTYIIYIFKQMPAFNVLLKNISQITNIPLLFRNF